MRILVSTFGGHDQDRVLSAMRLLPYERLVILGERDAADSAGLEELKRLEDVSGHALEFVEVDTHDFMDAVEVISETLTDLVRGPRTGKQNQLSINISGGSKMLSDAALFSAFRLGIEAFHCDGSATRLPVLKGAMVVDRFTESQVRFLKAIGTGPHTLDELTEMLEPSTRQSVDRTLRQLKKEGLLEPSLDSVKIVIGLSREGVEVVRALELSEPR